MRYNRPYMQPKKILIIEDSRSLADSLEDLLTFKGYQTIKANDGTTGLILARNEHPDLILLDLRLPDIDGFSVLRTLRKDDWGKSAKVLILTAADTSEAVPDDLNLTAESILHKSQWGIDNLSSRIEQELTT